jgi:hypothetical protein
MGLDPDAPSGEDARRSQFAARIDWQLTQHGALAGVGTGEAFHLMVGI